MYLCGLYTICSVIILVITTTAVVIIGLDCISSFHAHIMWYNHIRDIKTKASTELAQDSVNHSKNEPV